MTYPQLALDNVADVSVAVLVQLELVARPLLCENDKNRTRVSGCAMGSRRNSGEKPRTKDNDGNVYGAQHAEFVCLFEEPVLVLGAAGRGGGGGWESTTAGSVKNRENLPRHQHKNSHSRNSTTRMRSSSP